MDEAKCERIIARYNGEDIYVILGEDILMVKFPYENRKENERLRGYVDAICDAVTKRLQEKVHDEEFS